MRVFFVVSRTCVVVYKTLVAGSSTHQVTVVDGQTSGDGRCGDSPIQGGGRPLIVNHGRAENQLGRNDDLCDPNKQRQARDFSQFSLKVVFLGSRRLIDHHHWCVLQGLRIRLTFCHSRESVVKVEATKNLGETEKCAVPTTTFEEMNDLIQQGMPCYTVPVKEVE